MREAGIASAAGRIRLEFRRAAPHLDRAADPRVTFGVCCTDAVGIGLGTRRHELACARCVARADLDLELRCEVAEFRKPEATLVDEVERQVISPRRYRAAHVQLALDPLAGC